MPITERLPGCTARSLDAYLRGVGLFLLAGELDATVRTWWDDEGILCVASSLDLDALSAQVLEQLRRDPPSLRMPWWGKSGHDFAEARNDAREDELDWFDACALARPAEAPRERAPALRSDRENNPLLGGGGSFGNSKPEKAFQDALAKIVRLPTAECVDALAASLRGTPLDAKPAKRVSVTNKVLGAYQSGRATGAGSSIEDVEPTNQQARSSIWDIVLVFTGLQLFRGSSTRRSDPGARVQASFPFLVRSRPIGTGPRGVHELRVDDPRAFEFLAPLWSRPCTTRTLRHLVSSARLRVRNGSARDTLDAVLVQASRATHGLGFDRLVRFALVPVDPKKPARFAVRRGEVHARGLRSARRAIDEIVPFLRDIERVVREEPESLALAKRRLEDALAEFGREDQTPSRTASAEAARVQEALVAVALLQSPASRAAPERGAPWLTSGWLRAADDGTAEYRLARSLLAGLTTSEGKVSLLREAILPHRRDDRGRFVLDPTRAPPALEYVADPVVALAELHLAALRRGGDGVGRAGSARFDDVARLLAGELRREGERKVALLCAAFAGVAAAEPRPVPPGDPVVCGIGSSVAALLLAAQPAAGEECNSALERTEQLVSLLLAGRVEVAHIAADRELRRRGFDLLPPPIGSHRSKPALLALAVLLPFDQEARSALERVVSCTSIVPQEGATS